MSASMTRAKTPEGGHFGPPKSELEKPPSDWEMSPIGDLTLQTKQRNPERDPEKRFFYVDVSSVSNTSFRITAPTELSGAEAPSRARKVIQAGDVLFATVRPTLKRVALVPDDLHDQIASTGFIVLRSDALRLDSRYLYCHLLTDGFTQRMQELERGASYPAVRDSDILNEKIALPPLAEQRKIAGVLGLVQRAIEQQERLIALTTELKKTLLHKLFTEGLQGEPQKQTDIGPLPQSWETATLGELACKPDGALQTGPFGSQLHKHDYLSEGVGVVNPTHLWDNQINHEDVPRVSSETAARLERHRLEVGDILFARRGEIGRHGMVTEKEDGWLCGTGCFLARVRRKDIDNRFLSYFFSTSGCIAWLNSHAAGAIMPNLNNTVLRTMPVFFPKLEIQTKIANCLDATEQKMSIHQRRVAPLAALFRTLLHQLMTAQIRVHDLDLNEMQEHTDKRGSPCGANDRSQ